MKLLKIIGVFIIGLALEWLWTTYLPIFSLSPQVLLVLTIAIAAQKGPILGQCYGFLWGLCEDAWGMHVFGANALLLTTVGYLIGNFRRQMDASGLFSQGILTALTTPVYFLGMALIGFIVERSLLWPGWGEFLFAPIYNALIAPLAFALAQGWLSF